MGVSRDERRFDDRPRTRLPDRLGGRRRCRRGPACRLQTQRRRGDDRLVRPGWNDPGRQRHLRHADGGRILWSSPECVRYLDGADDSDSGITELQHLSGFRRGAAVQPGTGLLRCGNPGDDCLPDAGDGHLLYDRWDRTVFRHDDAGRHDGRCVQQPHPRLKDRLPAGGRHQAQLGRVTHCDEHVPLRGGRHRTVAAGPASRLELARRQRERPDNRLWHGPRRSQRSSI